MAILKLYIQIYMKTAMQELIEHIKNQFETIGYKISIEADSFLEKEKEQIKEAWYNGGINGMGLFETTTGEQYYNETYTNN